MRIFFLLFLLCGCLEHGSPPDPFSPYQCEGTKFLGDWKGEGENRVYLDKECWGVMWRCGYFFKFTPPILTGETVFKIEVTEGVPECLPRGEIDGAINVLGKEVHVQIGDILDVYQRKK